jgi:G:T/U-mismatch repair DNA glycosylase
VDRVPWHRCLSLSRFSGLAHSSGQQDETIAGAKIWLLPNPSGLNAHHQPPELAAQFRALNAVSRKT